MLESHFFDSGKEGVHLLVLGAVHGDETCGPNAIRKVVDELEKETFSILKGKVTFVPICNLDAHEKNVRFVEKNLNRIMQPHPTPENREQLFANEVCEFIKGADVMLDLHSFSAEGLPFLFLDHPCEEMSALADTLGGTAILYNWENVYEDTEPSPTTEHWAYENNTKGLTFECGQNGTKESDEVAYEAVLRTLSFYGMIQKEPVVCEGNPHHIKMLSLTFKEKEGTFSQNFKNIEKLPKGQEILRYEDGTMERMAFDGFLILPKHKAQIGEEWFYLGVPREKTA